MHESEKWKWSGSVVSDSSQPHGLQPTRLLRPWEFPGKSTGVGCHCLLWPTFLAKHKCLAISLEGCSWSQVGHRGGSSSGNGRSKVILTKGQQRPWGCYGDQDWGLARLSYVLTATWPPCSEPSSQPVSSGCLAKLCELEQLVHALCASADIIKIKITVVRSVKIKCQVLSAPAHGNHSVCAGRYKVNDDEDDCYHCDDSLPLAFLLIVELFNDNL